MELVSLCCSHYQEHNSVQPVHRSFTIELILEAMGVVLVCVM